MHSKITMVTPNFNGGAFLEKTILSVINQNYPNLEYIMVDGGSTDGSHKIIEKYKQYFAKIIIEPDEGLYFALNKGFAAATGDIMGWINSDDVVLEYTFSFLNDYFSKNNKVNWIQGIPNMIDTTGNIFYTRAAEVNKYFFLLDNYFQRMHFIQQESTFWRRSIWEKAGAKLDTNFKYAADFELWLRFFEFSNLTPINQKLGSFRKREGQISGVNLRAYLQECQIATKLAIKRMPLHKRMFFKLLRGINTVVGIYK